MNNALFIPKICPPPTSSPGAIPPHPPLVQDLTPGFTQSRKDTARCHRDLRRKNERNRVIRSRPPMGFQHNMPEVDDPYQCDPGPRIQWQLPNAVVAERTVRHLDRDWTPAGPGGAPVRWSSARGRESMTPLNRPSGGAAGRPPSVTPSQCQRPRPGSRLPRKVRLPEFQCRLPAAAAGHPPSPV